MAGVDVAVGPEAVTPTTATGSGITPVEPGVFLIDKPVGPTSFAMVQRVRRALGVKKVGHAGTLDPFASGLLVVCVGRPATRIIDQLMAGVKEYRAILQLGVETDTQDPEGRVIAVQPVTGVDEERIARVLVQFTGELMQTPPAYSALKHQGKPLYAYARKGIIVSKEPRRVVIGQLVSEGFDPDTGRLTVRVTCGKGTYIRTLGADIGRELGCGAHLVALRRLQSGPFRVEAAIDGALLADRDEARALLDARRLTVEAALAALAGGAGAEQAPQSA